MLIAIDFFIGTGNDDGAQITESQNGADSKVIKRAIMSREEMKHEQRLSNIKALQEADDITRYSER